MMDAVRQFINEREFVAVLRLSRRRNITLKVTLGYLRYMYTGH